MSTPASPRPLTPEHPTRQQLDELDALLQRMLALPVNPAEGEQASPAEPVAVPKGDEPSPVPVRPAPLRQTIAAEPSNAVLRGPTPAPTVPASKPVENTAADLPLLPPVLWRSLLWSNQTFDRWAGRLGAPGRWLRQPQGRAVLGWTGLLFLAAALVVVLLDWFGWTR